MAVTPKTSIDQVLSLFSSSLTIDETKLTQAIEDAASVVSEYDLSFKGLVSDVSAYRLIDYTEKLRDVRAGAVVKNLSEDPYTFTTVAASVNEVQVVTITGSPSGGTFTLTYSGQTTAGIAYNATAGTVQTALVALSTIGAGDVAVAGSAGGPWTVTFQNDLGFTNLAQMTASGAGLTGGTNPAVGVSTSVDGNGLLAAEDADHIILLTDDIFPSEDDRYWIENVRRIEMAERYYAAAMIARSFSAGSESGVHNYLRQQIGELSVSYGNPWAAGNVRGDNVDNPFLSEFYRIVGPVHFGV